MATTAETTATLRDARISPRKLRLVADWIRGLSADRAIALLTFNPRKGAAILRKVLNSAIENAVHNNGADVDLLRVSRVTVDGGTKLRRRRARARGRADLVMKPTSHVTVAVVEEEE